MNKDLTSVLSPNVKYILLTLFLLHFISFTECFITNRCYPINLHNSLNPTSISLSKKQYQQWFLSNNTDVSIDTDVSNNNVITTTQPKIDDDILQDKTKSEQELKFPVMPTRNKIIPYIDMQNITYLGSIIMADDITIAEKIGGKIEKLSWDGISTIWRYIVCDTGVRNLTMRDDYKFQMPGILVTYNTKISKALRELLLKEYVTVIKGEKLDDIPEIVELAKEQLKKFAIHNKIIELCGRAEIKEVFKASKTKNAARYVLSYGKLHPLIHVRITRGNKLVFFGKISTLTRPLDYGSDMTEGDSLWITFNDFNDIKVGDVIESYSCKFI